MGVRAGCGFREPQRAPWGWLQSMLGVPLAAGMGRSRRGGAGLGLCRPRRAGGRAAVGVRGWAGVSESGEGCGCPCGV